MKLVYYKWVDGELEFHNPITNLVSDELCKEVVITPKEAMLNPSSSEFTLGKVDTSCREISIMEIVNPNLELGISKINWREHEYNRYCVKENV